MKRRLYLGGVPVGVALVASALTLGVTALVGVAPWKSLPGLPEAAGPDASQLGARPLAPLDEAYVRAVLGESSIKGPRRVAERNLFSSARRSTLHRVVDLHPLTNDNVADARPIPSLPFTAKTDATAATRQSDEPSDCSSVGGSVWYRYTASRDVGLVATTFGTLEATALGIFHKTSDGFTRVGCDTDLGGNALYSFSVKRAAIYYFQVAFPRGGGKLVFNLEFNETTLQSASRTGEPGVDSSEMPSLSGDGRSIAFVTQASNVTGTERRPCAMTDPRDLTWPLLYGNGRLVQSPDAPCWQVVVRDRTTGRIRIASVSSGGELADSYSYGAQISGNGRHIVFVSAATNLVPDDTNALHDVFVHDLLLRRTERISVDSAERQMLDEPLGVAGARLPSISDDGRFVSFSSEASSLVPDDTNGRSDVFVRDRHLGTTTRISVRYDGSEAQDDLTLRYTFGQGRVMEARPSCISGDGRYVAFSSRDPLIVRGDTNGVQDVFVRDLWRETTRRVSVSSSGAESDQISAINSSRCISANGRVVAFNSLASNLASGDTNRKTDVYVHDVGSGRTVRASVSSEGKQSTSHPTIFPVISGDGRSVAFFSSSPDLVRGDTNDRDDVFMHDLRSRTTIRVSVGEGGEEVADESSVYPALSRDGRSVAYFSSLSQDFVPSEIDDLTSSLVPCVCVQIVLDPTQVYVYERTGGEL